MLNSTVSSGCSGVDDKRYVAVRDAVKVRGQTRRSLQRAQTQHLLLAQLTKLGSDRRPKDQIQKAASIRFA